MKPYKVVTSPYEGQSSKVYDYCLSEGIKLLGYEVVEESNFNMELVVFHLSNEEDYIKVDTFSENC